MIKVQNGVATREPIPQFLIGLPAQTLMDLTFTDPAQGVHDCAWWPEEDRSLQLGLYQRYGAETLTVNESRKVVIVTRAIVPWTAGEIAADKKAKVPQVVPMLNAHLVLIASGWMPLVRAYLDALEGIDGEQARVYFDKALTMRRDHPLVLGIPAGISKTEEEVDELFVAAGEMNV